ncbi:hypothetical protein [Nocardioides sp.]|uniref:hypothetical protein n=1 Tax=Nocardioides sp. TaxID=35761 RepID=UPI002ED35101
MTARPVVALWVVGWVVVAVAGATLAWGVISRAGGGVSGGLDTVSEPPGVARTPTDTATDTATGRTRSPSPTTAAPSPSSGDGGSTETPVSRTWQGQAGVVSASCRGGAITLDSAIAYSGYLLERDDVGPDRVRVEFETDDSRIRVEAECVDGEPVFSEDRSGEG